MLGLIDIVVLGVTVDCDRFDCSTDCFSLGPVDRSLCPFSSAGNSTGIPETNLDSAKQRKCENNAVFLLNKVTYAA